MPLWEQDEQRIGSAGTLTPERSDDVELARRRAPTFGVRPDDPTVPQVLRDFARRYGWRAYALPVLVVITVLALITTGDASKANKSPGVVPPGAGARPGPPTASGDIPLKSDQPGSGARNTVLSAAALPAGAAYTKTGAGTFRVISGKSPVVGSGTLHKYSVEVENGISGVDLGSYANQVQTVLSDVRSWAGHNRVALQRVNTGADFRVTLVSSMTVRSLCGYDIPIETSCYVPSGTAGSDVNRVVINVARWVRGDAAYVGDLSAYRVYLINHEDGHALGHQHAHQCLPGGLAPVMMQQTIGLRSAATHKMCAANPWPYPVNAAGAPGAEQADTPQNTEVALKND
ncbi:MAG: DUF3152 domain-containing protein [Actinomycetota bacterium]|nr:DUF3152 domain-containing protein [Actinomycetota bacterium]